MNELDGIVEFYLKNETNNALLITGDWGTGKTYYYKNFLQQKIETVPVYRLPNKNYKSLIISLFGITNIEELQSQIFLSLFPLLKNKKVKIGISIAKAFIKVIMKVKDFDKYYDVISETKIETKDLIDFNNLVICFDDLERISPNLQLEELIGFINSLTESNNTKVIIIANENQIEKNNYISLKEKVIGNTIEFEPNIPTVFNRLITEKYSDAKSYILFLNENEEYILKNFISHSKNIRTLHFTLNYFHSIFATVEINKASFKFIEENSEKILRETLKFSLSLAIEYKNGKINYRKKDEIDNSNFEISELSLEKLSFNHNRNQEEIPKTYKELFLEKYYDKDSYSFYESIFNFITGGRSFNANEFINELKIKFNVQNGEIPIHYQLFNKLKYPNVFYLSNNDYFLLTKEILQYSDKGAFNIGDYTSIFYFIARFNSPLGFKLENLEKRVIRGMKKGKKNYEYIPSLNMYLSFSQDGEYYENYQNIVKACLKINDELKDKLDKIKYEKLEKLLEVNFDEFELELINDNNYSAVLNNINYKVFFKSYVAYDIPNKWKVNSLFKYRFQNNIINLLQDELEFLKPLQIKIQTKLKNIPKSGLECFVYNDFNNTLIYAINILEGKVN